MSKWDKLTENKDVIISKYLSGESTCQLGREYECNNGYIWKFLRYHDVKLRPFKTVEPNKEKILVLHKMGKTAYRINKDLGLTDSTAERALAQSGIDISHRQKKRADPLKNHKEEILSRYAEGEGVHLIGTDFGCQDASIIRFLRRYGAKLRPLRHYSYPVNEHFFDTVDTEVKAYILGFLMADGCNQEKLGVVGICITDEDILRRMAAEMSSEHPIKIVPGKLGCKTQYCLKIGSRVMSDAVARLGCVSRKTYVATFPNRRQVPYHLQRHLIRGWNDGDGTITGRLQRGKRAWFSRIVGTEAACRGISNCVFSHLGFRGCVCPVHKGPKHTTWGFSVGAQAELKTYLDWLYRDSTIHLQRKYDKYQEFLAV